MIRNEETRLPARSPTGFEGGWRNHLSGQLGHVVGGSYGFLKYAVSQGTGGAYPKRGSPLSEMTESEVAGGVAKIVTASANHGVDAVGDGDSITLEILGRRRFAHPAVSLYMGIVKRDQGRFVRVIDPCASRIEAPCA